MTFMRGGGFEEVLATLNNMAASIVGMICTGGNHACCMKVLAAVDTAVTSTELALSGKCIAYPGMTEPERVILEIMQNKKGGAKGHEETD